MLNFPGGDDDQTLRFAARALGAFVGVIASMIMVAPEGTRGAFYRVLIGVGMGTIFAPAIDNIWLFDWLAGDELDLVLARGAACGFGIWFVLEASARLMSSTEWVEKLLREILRLRGGKQ